MLLSFLYCIWGEWDLEELAQGQTTCGDRAEVRLRRSDCRVHALTCSVRLLLCHKDQKSLTRQCWEMLALPFPVSPVPGPLFCLPEVSSCSAPQLSDLHALWSHVNCMSQEEQKWLLLCKVIVSWLSTWSWGCPFPESVKASYPLLGGPGRTKSHGS